MTAFADYETLVQTFERTGLPLPPVPDKFKDHIRRLGEWCWSTRDVDPMEMYKFERYVSEACATILDDYIAVSHAGHGANSYAISLHVAFGPLALFTQAPYGGLYNNRQAEIGELADQFARARALLRVASRLRPSPTGRLIVAESTLRGTRLCEWVPAAGPVAEDWDKWIAANRIVSLDPISAAAGWLRAMETGA